MKSERAHFEAPTNTIGEQTSSLKNILSHQPANHSLEHDSIVPLLIVFIFHRLLSYSTAVFILNPHYYVQVRFSIKTIFRVHSRPCLVISSYAVLYISFTSMGLISLAIRLFRIAGEALFYFELNRFLGRAIKGSIQHRVQAIRSNQAKLLSHVCAPTTTHTLQLPSGLHIHTIVAGSAAVEPQNHGPRPLVLLHGHSMAGALFFRNIDHFIEMGFTSIFIPDLPGWGSSSRAHFQGHVNDAIDFFLTPFNDWLLGMNISTFALVGHSLGAYLAHEYATMFPLRVTRLILTSPAAITRYAPTTLAMWFTLTPQRLLTHGGLLAHILFNTQYPSHYAYNLPGFREFILFANSVAHNSGDGASAAMIRFVRTGMLSWKYECVRPLLDNISLLPCNINIITGDKDCLVDVEAVRTLHQTMLAAGNRVTLEVIPGADHSPHICVPDKFAKAVMRSLSDTNAPQPFLHA